MDSMTMDSEAKIEFNAPWELRPLLNEGFGAPLSFAISREVGGPPLKSILKSV